MKDEQLNRILRLVKKTNDKFVVLDKETDDTHVVMSLDSYEDLLDGNELAGTSSLPPRDPSDGSENFVPSKTKNVSPDSESDFSNLDLMKEELPEHLSDPRPPAMQPQALRAGSTEPLDFSGNWPASNASRSDAGWAAQNAAVSEESLADVPHEEEEEKFYLEPVE